MKILFIDHDDSFSNNIISFFRKQECLVDNYNHNSISKFLKNKLLLNQYNLIVLSPGPGSPKDYPLTIELYQLLNDIPVLGICLGHQIMLFVAGGYIAQISDKPIHGRQIIINKEIRSAILGYFQIFGSAVLYNSLGYSIKDPIFKHWNTLLHENEICLMAEHREKPHLGIQFHPESFASSLGAPLLTRVIRSVQQL